MEPALPTVPDPFAWLEPASLAVIAIYVARRFLTGRAQGLAFLRDYLLLVPAAWLAEDSAIRLYGFYAYHPGWHLFLDRVPVMIALIWPVVVLSAGEVARRVLPGRRTLGALATAAIVVLDAVLIESVSTRSGLWSWSRPGPFGVPPMGVLGWGCFALAAAVARERLPAWTMPIAAPAITHVLLLATWWGALRWIPGAPSEVPFVVGVAVVCVVLAGCALAWRRRIAMPIGELAVRGLAAGVFFALLALYNRDHTALIGLVAAVSLPWLSLVSREGYRQGSASGSPARTQTL